MSSANPIQPLNIGLLTISDTRKLSDDKSGNILKEAAEEAGHTIGIRKIIPDDLYIIRSEVSQMIADKKIQAIITTGGTGLTGRDITPEAVEPLYDKAIPGFGEIFRSLSYELIKTSTIQSRAVAGIANGTPIFSLPGSPGACKDGWNGIIKHQLDINYKPCNLVEIMPRFKET